LATAQIAKHFKLTVSGAAQPLGQVIHQSGEFFDKCLFGQLHRLIKARQLTLAFLLVQLGAELTQVRRRFAAGEVMFDGKHVDQGRGKVSRIKQIAQPACLTGWFGRAVFAGEVGW